MTTFIKPALLGFAALILAACEDREGSQSQNVYFDGYDITIFSLPNGAVSAHYQTGIDGRKPGPEYRTRLIDAIASTTRCTPNRNTAQYERNGINGHQVWVTLAC